MTLEKAQQDLLRLAHSKYRRIYKVGAITRGSGEYREFVCMSGVTKALAGGVLPYNSAEKFLLPPVYDFTIAKRLKAAGGPYIDEKGKTVRSAYRSIAMEGIVDYTIAGVKYVVER